MEFKDLKICLTGGGTGGSVTPLVALFEELTLNNDIPPANFYWLGSRNGLERSMVIGQGIAYKPILSGKLRRYFSWRNLIDPIFIALACFQALYYLIKDRPDIIMTAGSFVAVPVAWAGWCLRIPVVAHQMDVRPGLANRLIAPFAKKITVTFNKSIADYGDKAVHIGNLLRVDIKKARIIDKSSLYSKFGFNSSIPVILVVGGGTGAQAINELVYEARTELEKFTQIIHQTGAGKGSGQTSPHYQQVDFLAPERLSEAYALADIVISRAGLGFITELSYLAKPSVVIPIPGNHQEDNAELLRVNEAAIVLNQDEITSDIFVSVIKKLLEDVAVRFEISSNISKLMPAGAEEKVIEIIKELTGFA